MATRARGPQLGLAEAALTWPHETLRSQEIHRPQLTHRTSAEPTSGVMASGAFMETLASEHGHGAQRLVRRCWLLEAVP